MMTEEELDLERRVANKWRNLRTSAAERGLEFGLTLAQLRSLMKRKRCYYTGKKFTEEDGLSLDRVDSSRGYVPNNLVACLTSVNHIKSNLSPQLLVQLGQGIERHQLKNRKVNNV